MEKKKVVVICGPTASGKTALSIELAKKINGEIVSADSMQIYKDMDIGTAKPTKKEMSGIKHYLIDCVSPAKRYSVANYKIDAMEAIEKIISEGKTPIIVGGTGLYIDSLIYGIEYNETKIDEKYRAYLDKLAEEKGTEHLYKMAKEIDEEAMKKISINDKKRICRVLEIYKSTGKTKTELEIESRKKEIPYDYKIFAIDMDRELLYDRINKRVDIMISDGLVDEVKNLAKKYKETPTAMQGLGYKEILEYLNGECTEIEAIEKIKQESRRYAKRQLTWFRRNKDIKWLNALDGAERNSQIILEEIGWGTIDKKSSLERKKVLKITAVLITIVVFMYIVALLINIIRKPTETFVAENGRIYSEESVQGYIIRNENPIAIDDISRGIVPVKIEGEKVAKGEKVYRYCVENEKEVNAKIESLDLEIQNNIGSEDTFFSTDIKLLNNQIDKYIDRLCDDGNNLSWINQEKNSINSSLTQKVKIKAENSEDENLKALISQRNELESSLTNNSEFVYSDYSGVISYKVDGLEDKLTCEDFSYLNEDFLEDLDLQSGQIIASNTDRGKIIDNFKCYIVCLLKSDEANNVPVNKNVKIRLKSSEEIPAKIVYKAGQDDGKQLIVFEINKCVTQLIQYRKTSFDIIWWSDSGLKIPNSVLKYDGDVAYVIRNRGGLKEKIFVKVLKSNDKYSIVSNYTYSELEDLGFDAETLRYKKSISVYDEIEN